MPTEESIITPEEQNQFDELTNERRNLDVRAAEIRASQTSLIENIFLRFLQKGKWSVDPIKVDPIQGDVMRVKPKDIESDNLMTKLLMTTFNLGWHDGFAIFAKSVYIGGNVDDGRLTLFLDTAGRKVSSVEVRDNLGKLNLDFDFGEMIRTSKLEKAAELKKQIEGATAKLKKLQEELGEQS